MCVDVRDPGNAGALIRSADAAGAGGVVCCDGTVDPFNPKTVQGVCRFGPPCPDRHGLGADEAIVVVGEQGFAFAGLYQKEGFLTPMSTGRGARRSSSATRRRGSRRVKAARSTSW